jgi:hypothetical protein
MGTRYPHGPLPTRMVDMGKLRSKMGRGAGGGEFQPRWGGCVPQPPSTGFLTRCHPYSGKQVRQQIHGVVPILKI